MTGIVALHHSRRERPVDPDLIRRLGRTLRHRGPDGEGYFVEGPIALGARLGATAPAQPARGGSGHVLAVLDGILTNAAELTHDLAAAGHRLEDPSDAQLVAHLYEDLGDDCVHRLEGEFAILVWDAARRRLLGARDRLGAKPLCFAPVGDGLALASEEKALLQHPDVRARADEVAVQDYLLVGTVWAPRTLFADIQALPPGHLLVSEAGPLRMARYWDVPFLAPADDELDQVAASIDARLRHAVARRLRADGPVGACLSGGLDSSTVAALAALAHRGHGPLPTFTVSYPTNRALFEGRREAAVDGVRDDDAAAAAEVARAFTTEHHELELAAEDLDDVLDRAVWTRDRPLYALTEHGHARLFRAAAAHVKVMLSGEGGDEVFGGYPYWMARRTPENTDFFPWVWRAPAPIELGRAATAHDIIEAALDPGVAAPGAARARLGEVFRDLLAHPATADFGNRLRYLLITITLPELLAVEDRHGAAAGVEVRTPLVDSRVVELAAPFPSALKEGPLVDKRMLREGPARILPEAVRLRGKGIFPIPLAADEFWRRACGRLAGPHLAIHRWVTPTALASVFGAPDRPATVALRVAALRLHTLERWHALFGVS